MPSTLSVIIASKNCEDRIAHTIKPWKGFANEIIVVDQLSTDRTAELAQSEGAVVLTNDPANGNFDVNRKLGMQRAKSDWILYIDTDERPSGELLVEIKEFLADAALQKDIEGIRIPNEFYFLGKPLRHGLFNATSSEIRMFKKGSWKYSPEDGFHRGVSVSGRVIRFKAFYKHFNVNSISEWFIKTNQYTELDSVKLATDENYKVSLFKIFFNAKRFFIKHYIFKLGFLDGAHGLISIYYFMNYHLTLGVKVWEKRFLRGRVVEEDYLVPLQIPKR